MRSSVVFIAVGACAAFQSVLLHGETTPQVKLTDEPTLVKPALNLSGIVRSSDGGAAAGATVFLRAAIGSEIYTTGVKHNRDVLARTTTNAEGAFSFTNVGLPPRMVDTIERLRRGKSGVEIVVLSKGQAIHSSNVNSFELREPLLLQLEPESHLRGEVYDDAGQPIAGATVRLFGATKATRRMDGFFGEPGDLNLNLSQIDLSCESDSAGQFEFHHAPSDCRLMMVCEAPSKQRLVFLVDTGNHTDLEQVKMGGRGGVTLDVKRSPLSLTLAPAKTVVVNVLDHEGKPVTDGAVQALTEKRQFTGWEALNVDGVARIPIKETGKLVFQYGSDPIHPRLGASVSADISADAEAPEVEIRLPRPRPLTGRVVDAETGEPVGGVYLSYAATKDDDEKTNRGTSTCVTGRDGRFQIPVFAGQGRLYFMRDVYGYFPPTHATMPDPNRSNVWYQKVNVPEAGDMPPVTLKLARGLVVQGLVHDSAGKPMAGAKIRGEAVRWPPVSRTAITGEDGSFTLSALSPHVQVLLFAASDEGSASQLIDGQPDFPWDTTRMEHVDLTLATGVRLTGRVLKDGRPLPGVQMKLTKYLPLDAQRLRPQPGGEATTDADGRYSIAGLAPGDSYSLDVIAPNGLVAPDWQHQSPYISKLSADVQDEVQLPDVNLISSGQTLQGIVVDPTGKPVAGITVSCRLASGMGLSRSRTGNQPWMTTEADGRFELTELPDQPLELMAYKSNPQGGRIQNISKVRPRLNQRDIRIIYDPALDTQPEDLDAPQR